MIGKLLDDLPAAIRDVGAQGGELDLGVLILVLGRHTGVEGDLHWTKHLAAHAE